MSDPKPTNADGPARVIVTHEDDSTLVRLDLYFHGYYDALIAHERITRELQRGGLLLQFEKSPEGST